ncbi:MAG: cyanuric acid amidohydrolase [Actinomycetota bacterium]|jgi:cyanuric acid amidohydrolase|nr:cyanuric acid amidohydrolase [Actinomycetota bacterium]
MMRANRLLAVPTDGAGDTASVEKALSAAGLDIGTVTAVMCMTEGDGGGRGYAALALGDLWRRLTGHDPAIPFLMIGGCCGLVSPYAGLFIDDPAVEWVAAGDPRGGGMAVGVAVTPPLPAVDVGTLVMVDAVADAVRGAMASAGIDSATDVHSVQVKGPWPMVGVPDPNRAGALSRAAGALGAACAVGEVDRSRLTDADLATNWTLQSDVASVSSGNEMAGAAVLVIGNSPTSTSPFRAGHAVLADGIDAGGVRAALRSAGLADSADLSGPDNPVAHAFVKSAVDLAGECRGRRHVLGSDYLAPYGWLIGKAVIHATVASITGDPLMQVSGGAEHQGPRGGGLLAVIVRR